MGKLKKRKDGRYQMTFTYEGKRYSVYASSIKELDEKKVAKLIQLQERQEQHDNPTLDHYYETFTELRRNKVREATIRTQSIQFRACANVLIDGIRLGDMKIRSINGKDIQLVQSELFKTGKSADTVNNYTDHLGHVFRDAVKDRTIDWNPCQAISHLRRTKEKAQKTIHRALSEEETKTFMEAARKSFYYNLYCFQLQTGMRIGEVTALTAADFDKNYIHITKTITRTEAGGYTVGVMTKTDAGRRDIPLTDTVRCIVAAQKALKLRYGLRNVLLFPSQKKNTILREYTVNRDIKRICKKIELEPKFTSHALRDTFATRWMEQRPQEFLALSKILGHENVEITLNMYAQVMAEQKKKTLEQIVISM